MQLERVDQAQAKAAIFDFYLKNHMLYPHYYKERIRITQCEGS